MSFVGGSFPAHAPRSAFRSGWQYSTALRYCLPVSLTKTFLPVSIADTRLKCFVGLGLSQAVCGHLGSAKAAPCDPQRFAKSPERCASSVFEISRLGSPYSLSIATLVALLLLGLAQQVLCLCQARHSRPAFVATAPWESLWTLVVVLCGPIVLGWAGLARHPPCSPLPSPGTWTVLHREAVLFGDPGVQRSLSSPVGRLG